MSWRDCCARHCATTHASTCSTPAVCCCGGSCSCVLGGGMEVDVLVLRRVCWCCGGGTETEVWRLEVVLGGAGMDMD